MNKENFTYEEFLKRLSVSSKELLTHSPIAEAIFGSDKNELGNSTLESDNNKENLLSKLSIETELTERPIPSPSSSSQHDGSMESVNSINIGLEARSFGKFSLRGRNMKEYEEQLSHLKNENFSLKLRVYFLEERIGQKYRNDDKDDLCRANMELKVETEALKKELYEKQELVHQASILLSTLEDQYRETMQKVQRENLFHTEALQERINQLERMEPHIEVRVQEIIERDRIIEEKMEQLEQQNKILVEIQITLDEQQKQNAELETNLAHVKQLLQEKIEQLDVSCGTVKELAEKLMVVEKENNKLRKDLNRKEKKVEDLKSELKESIEMLQNANMEAHNNSVKEMADDEHEGLWAELELRKNEVQKLRKEKESASQEAEARMMELERRAVFAERLLINTNAKEAVLNSDKIDFSAFDHSPEKIKQLQKKFYKDRENVNNLDLIKEILQDFNIDKNVKPKLILNSAETQESNNPKKAKDDFSEDKSQKDPGFSTLENALFAHMGQKLYNTSQTFNTYVLSGSNEEENYEWESTPQVIPCAPPEHFETQTVKVSDIPLKMSQFSNDTTSSLQEAEVKKLCEEMASIKREAKALRDDRLIINEKLMHLQNDKKSLDGKSIVHPNQSRIPVRTKRPHDGGEKIKSQPLLNKCVLDDLKNDFKTTKKAITLKIFHLVSKKYRDSVKKYKKEIFSLRTQLTDSHNACDILRTRLEELVRFLEQIIDMEKNGIINLSSWTPQRRATLHRTLNDSRALSQSLSQSLMIGMEFDLDNTSRLGGTAFSLALDSIPQEIDITQMDLSVENNLNNSVDIFEISFDLSDTDSVNSDIIYETIKGKIYSHDNGDTVETDDIEEKFNQINDIIRLKDKNLANNTNLISNLRDEVFLLRDEISVKNDVINNIGTVERSETTERACSPIECENKAEIQDEYMEEHERKIEHISNENNNAMRMQEQMISEQKCIITQLTESVQSLKEKLENTLQSNQDLENKLEMVDIKVLRVTKENHSLLVDKTNLQSQLCSADANINFFRKDREHSVSEASSNHNYQILLAKYKAYQTAVIDLEAQNEKLSAEKDSYKYKSERLRDELETIWRQLKNNERNLSAVHLENSQSPYNTVESKRHQLQPTYERVIGNRSIIDVGLQSFDERLPIDSSNYSELRSKELYKHIHDSADRNSLESTISGRNVELLNMIQLDDYKNTSSGILTPSKSSMSHNDFTKQSLFSPQRRQTNIDSLILKPSDAQILDKHLFSTTDRHSENITSVWQKGLECRRDLCTDPSHSELAIKNEQLNQYNWELEESLKSTKSSLKDTLDSVAAAKEKQESVERAINKQLNKTHNVLRKAKVNLKRNVNSKPSDESSANS